MTISRVETWGAGFRALGAYSPAVVAGDLCFVSGQLPIDHSSGALVEGGIETQTRAALESLVGVLKAAGFTRSGVVQLTVLLADVDDWELMDRVIGDELRGALPARIAYQAGALPMGALVEIQAIAAR